MSHRVAMVPRVSYESARGSRRAVILFIFSLKQPWIFLWYNIEKPWIPQWRRCTRPADPDRDHCNLSSPSFLEWDSLTVFLESVMSRLMKSGASQSVITDGIQLLEATLAHETSVRHATNCLRPALTVLRPALTVLRPALTVLCPALTVWRPYCLVPCPYCLAPLLSCALPLLSCALSDLHSAEPE